jgi:peptide/nickel transport system permease protein
MNSVPKIVLLWSDGVVWALVLAAVIYTWHVSRRQPLRDAWSKVARNPAALCSAVVLLVFVGITLLDSVHFRRALEVAGETKHVAYSTQTESLLDAALASRIASREVSYSAPLASRGFTKLTQQVDGRTERDYPRLANGGVHLKDDRAERGADLLRRAAAGLALGGMVALVIGAVVVGLLARRSQAGFKGVLGDVVQARTALPWRAAWLTLLAIGLLAGAFGTLATHYHVFGTDRTGNDVLLQALKSIRTAFVIGTLSTLATLPLAVALGIGAGYFKGWVDELIQYLYTVLSSVPNVLLIAACVLMMQVFIDSNAELFETGAERADARLVLLCVILGVTGWATLCRLLRAETLKLRELDYVQAATAFGVGPVAIMRRHIFPNVAHLIVITTVLDFSSLVLYEAVLSYVGVGVDPSMNSFGGMINLARSEMSRDPVVWWSFAAAFLFMVVLVLAANLFADGVRDAFDPRARVMRVRRLGAARAVR